MLKQPDLVDLKKGDTVNHYLMIRKVEERSTKAGKAFLSLELSDKSAGINANVWNDTSGFELLSGKANPGEIIKVSGLIDEYQGVPQIKLTSVSIVDDSAGVTACDFLSKSSRNPDEMGKELLNRVVQIKNSNLKTLLKNIFSGEGLEKFKIAPAGKSWHHGYLHGLIEHTLEIVKLCDLMCDFHKELNRDLLVAGALLHDFGKTEELNYDSVFDYSDKGKLIGHIVICASMIEQETKKINGFPEELKNLLIHLVLSHQGKLEYASPVVPKIPEAIALYQADELSAKVNAYINSLKSEVTGDGKWTKFIHLAQTDLYRRKNSGGKNGKINNSLFD